MPLPSNSHSTSAGRYITSRLAASLEAADVKVTAGHTMAIQANLQGVPHLHVPKVIFIERLVPLLQDVHNVLAALVPD